MRIRKWQAVRVFALPYAMQCTLYPSIYLHLSIQSQTPLLRRLLITLHLIARLKCRPILKAHAAFGALAHLRDVLLDVFEGRERA